MTECTQSRFRFEGFGSREIVAQFDGGTISSDGGALLLRQTDKRLNLLPRLAGCFLDGRQQERVEHSIEEMLAQRIYGLALGYEDLNDHEQLRKDPLTACWGTGGSGYGTGGQEHAEPDGIGDRRQRPLQEDHVLEGSDRRVAGETFPRITGA